MERRGRPRKEKKYYGTTIKVPRTTRDILRKAKKENGKDSIADVLDDAEGELKKLLGVK